MNREQETAMYDQPDADDLPELTFEQLLAVLANIPSIPLDAREQLETVLADNFPTDDWNV